MENDAGQSSKLTGKIWSLTVSMLNCFMVVEMVNLHPLQSKQWCTPIGGAGALFLRVLQVLAPTHLRSIDLDGNEVYSLISGTLQELAT